MLAFCSRPSGCLALPEPPPRSGACIADHSPLCLITQIHPNGLRHIRADKRIQEWKTPGKKTIVRSAVNARQVVIALSGGELVSQLLLRLALLFPALCAARSSLACL